MTRYHPDDLDRRSPDLIATLLPAMETLSRHYLRLQAEGLEHLPHGPALFVANHNGGIFGPDLLCTLSVLWRALGPASPLFALAHDFPMRQFTPLGRLLQKLGAVSANRGNANRILAAGGKVLVYPGGDLEAYRHSRRRNEVILLPRTGFIEVARANGVPIIPVVVQGAHRCAYIFTEGKAIARFLRLQQWARLERFPVAFALPWGVALGPWLPYLPLPFPLRLRLLPPVHIAADADPLQAARHVQGLMQQALNEMAAL